jgi:hypothetical protein
VCQLWHVLYMRADTTHYQTTVPPGVFPLTTTASATVAHLVAVPLASCRAGGNLYQLPINDRLLAPRPIVV